MTIQRLLVVASPDVRIEDVRDELFASTTTLSEDGPVELVLMCNNVLYVLDWQIEKMAQEKRWRYTAAFKDERAVVNYVKGHSVLIFQGSQACPRCKAVAQLARKARDWFSRSKYRPGWRYHKIRLRIVNV